MLRFSKANAKIKALSQVPAIAHFLKGKKKVYSFDLLSGWSCPFASQCLSKVVTGPDNRRRIVDGLSTEFRCFSASQEVVFPALYNLRRNNYTLMKSWHTTEQMTAAIQEYMPPDMGVCRIHVGGEFFNQLYFDAWVQIAVDNPSILFYAYTKSLPYWMRYEYVSSNFVLTASRGGTRDDLIRRHNIREAVVVFSEMEAKIMGLEIDHDDSHAADPSKAGESFALLLHGIQPKGSKASEALSALRGKGSYTRKVGVK